MISYGTEASEIKITSKTIVLHIATITLVENAPIEACNDYFHD